MVKELVEIIKRDQGLDLPSKPKTLTEKDNPSLKPAIPVWAEVNSQGVPKIVQATIDTQLKVIHHLCCLTPGPGAQPQLLLKELKQLAHPEVCLVCMTDHGEEECPYEVCEGYPSTSEVTVIFPIPVTEDQRCPYGRATFIVIDEGFLE